MKRSAVWTNSVAKRSTAEGELPNTAHAALWGGQPLWPTKRSMRGDLRERLVEVHRGADEAEMREGLWEVAEVAPRGIHFLGVEAEVVRVPVHLLEEEPGLVEVAGAREALDEPVGAHAERALAAR